MFRPRQISFRFRSIIFSRGKSRHPMRNSGPFFVIRLSFTSRTKNSVCYFLISTNLQVRCGLRLLTHRFPTRIQGHLGLFSCFSPSTLPFPGRKLAQKKYLSSGCIERLENKLTNIPPKTKNGVDPPLHLLSTINYRHSVINSWLIRSWSYQ
jgi:hypothetical protein